jgi:LysR family transcriptional regulator of abg operon
MKLNQLRALVAIAKAGSIQEAARLMHLTQPALSKSIRELEREVGVPLLVRSTKGATLTPYGAMIAKRSRAIQKEVDKIREEIDSLRGELGGRLSIGLTPPAAGAALADAVSLFRQQRPSVELQLLELRPAQITDGLRDGALDLGIVTQYGEAEPAGLKWAKLYSLKTLLAVGGKRAHRKVAVEELADMEWLALDGTEDPNGYISTLFSQFDADGAVFIYRPLPGTCVTSLRRDALGGNCISGAGASFSRGANDAARVERADAGVERVARLSGRGSVDVRCQRVRANSQCVGCAASWAWRRDCLAALATIPEFITEGYSLENKFLALSLATGDSAADPATA